MKGVTHRVVVAYYSATDVPLSNVEKIHRRRLGRAVTLHRSANRIVVEPAPPSEAKRFTLAGLGALLVAFGLSLLGVSPVLSISAGMIIMLGFYVAVAWHDPMPKDLVAEVSHTLLAGECALVVYAPPSKLSDVLSLLRQNEPPSTFLLRFGETCMLESPAHAEGSPLRQDHLRNAASELAHAHSPRPPARPRQDLLHKLKRAEADIEKTGRDLVESVQLEQPLSNSAEWLYDNLHLIRANIAEIRQNLPANYQRVLPTLSDEKGDITLRAEAVATELVALTDCAINEVNLVDFLAAYQSASSLTIAELWILPLLVRLALIEKIRGLAERVCAAERQREFAYFWGDRLTQAAQHVPEDLASMLELLNGQPIQNQTHFLARLTEHFHDDVATLPSVREWLEHQAQTPLADLIRKEHSEQAATRILIANAVGTMRRLAEIDFKDIFERVSHVEAILRTDPSGIYPRTDFATRDRCRRSVEQVARHSSLTETEVADLAIRTAGAGDEAAFGRRQVEYYLLDDGLAEIEKIARCRRPASERMLRQIQKYATFSYLSSVIFLTLTFVFSAAALSYFAGLHSWTLLLTLACLALCPAAELAVRMTNSTVVALLPPRTLPRMSFEEGIPDECTTLVVVPMMLLTPSAIRSEIEKLEIRYLANQDANLYFSLLSDYTDAPQSSMPEDDELLQVALEGIGKLNERHPGNRFLLFHRTRRWSESEQRWIGWERKRGKIEELAHFLNGHPVPYERFLLTGSLPLRVEFVITLDADTQLPSATARRMVETIGHPLNRVQLSADGRNRIRGYTIIQPRVSITLPVTTATRFTRLFTDATGTDPYCQAVSDAYQDLFGEGIYLGKAIFDVRAFYAILDNRFPQETLLSHDLIEGVYAGVALASEIELFESFPYDYQSHSKRQHRWIRGDWQISPWLRSVVPSGGGREPSPLSVISRWKILDNLRRSLVSVTSVALLLMAWILGATPGIWTVFIALMLAVPAVAHTLNGLALSIQGRHHYEKEGWTELTRTVLTIALLHHQAWISGDAIVRVIYRRSASRRHLLEWETAELTHLRASRHFNLVYVQILALSIATAFLTSFLFYRGILAPLPFLLLWMAAAPVLRWISAPVLRRDAAPLLEAERLELSKVARQTWRFFDDLVGPETNWLPPDNSQVALRVEVAMRTSPTNIGMWLTSALAAVDFGYLTPDEFLERCEATMNTLEKLDRYEGHLMNWYNIQTLEPLQPRYVSTVDSGNLIASLWVVEAGCRQMTTSPLLSAAVLDGLADTLSAARDTIDEDSPATLPFATLGGLFRETDTVQGMAERIRLAVAPVEKAKLSLRWAVVENTERAYWLTQLEEHAGAWVRIIDRYLRWLELLAAPPSDFVAPLGKAAIEARREALQIVPTLAALAAGPSEPLRHLLAFRSNPMLGKPQRSWLDELSLEFGEAQQLAAETVARVESIVRRMSALSNGINMRFLYDVNRRLFAIGYSIGGPLDYSTHYDLLVSEARLSSLVAIAKGEVPIDHWLALGRPYVSEKDGQLLLSWSGTMFEYLMPLLFNYSYENSMLDHSCRLAVRRQIEYADERGIPWGISEAAFAALDANQIYQYMAFGVPGLGLKRGLGDGLVVSPYSTMLALMVDRPHAIENLRRLQQAGLRGEMGFYESIDYRRQRTREGGSGVIIYAYMAHHQGMSLVSLDNVLHRDAMRQRFHGDQRIRATESLLYEGIPKLQSLLPRTTEDVSGEVRAAAETAPPADRVFGANTAVPRVHLLGNGRYSLMVTNSGGGYSKWHDFALTPWRADTTRDHWGAFCYVRDIRTGRIWSTAQQPAGADEENYSAIFSPDRVEFVRRDGGIECQTEITVSPEEDAEIRRVTLTNRSLRPRMLEVTSFCELALAPPEADRAHPVFSRLFIQTEALPDLHALLATRRPRSATEQPVWTGHLIFGGEENGDFDYSTDRAAFLGRGSSWSRPAGLNLRLGGITGTVLDPMFALRRRISLEPRERLRLTFVTVAGDSREAVLNLIDRFRSEEACRRAFELAWTHAQLELRYLGIQAETAHRFQELASYMLYPHPRMRAPAERIRQNSLPQSRLWAHGISGDLPIALVVVADAREIPLVREVLLAHTFWRIRGLKTDLVILNQEAQAYDQPLREQLFKLIQAHTLHTGIDQAGGVFLRSWHQFPADELTLLLSSARVVVGPGRSLVEHLSRSTDTLPAPARAVPPEKIKMVRESAPPLPFLELPYFNGLGGFSGDGREYSIYLGPGQQTPMPWVNVMANPAFGAMVSESGSGFCWFGNSQMNRLTPWVNDPVMDSPSEAIYIRDDDTGEAWTPTPLPVREPEAYRANHGAGYTRFEHNSHGIEQLLITFVPLNGRSGDPVRIQRVLLRNSSDRRRRLSVVTFTTWALGSHREANQPYVVTEWDAASRSLFARNAYNPDYGSRIAFAATAPEPDSYTADRTSFLGRNGSLARPSGLDYRRLSMRAGAALDPCAAFEVKLSLEPGEQREVTYLVGQAASREEARELIGAYRDRNHLESAFNETRQHWDELLSAIQVRTPVMSVNFLLNRWLLYQTLSCRFWGRSALYQSGGAFGYRDQLQDCLAFLWTAPQISREHILRAASRQFLEGDVQHWWHPPGGGGIRSRCSDDLLWLPFAVCRYMAVTGDKNILAESVSFLEGPVLKSEQHETYFTPGVTTDQANLFEHCRRAIEKGLTKGPHGLPLIGSGDWNDGMNLVGAEGHGESVWLAWFLIDLLRDFAQLCEDEGHDDLARRYRAALEEYRVAAEEHAWDGEWYRRAYHDDGTPLGSAERPEAQIDSLPQTWAVICGAADAVRSKTAMHSAEQRLVRDSARLVLLFTPPFDHSEPHPGYIQGYPPGVRENGGQYTHGALWMAQAFARLGDGERAVKILQYLNPVEMTPALEQVNRYKGEPYVMPADVYNLPGRIGRCGWTWYTGSSGWTYRIWIEEVLGFRVRGDVLTLRPVLPPDWPECSITYRYHSATYEISIRNVSGEESRLTVDGQTVPDGRIALADDGQRHSVLLTGTAGVGQVVPAEEPAGQVR